jgi:hypothetical protein
MTIRGYIFIAGLFTFLLIIGLMLNGVKTNKRLKEQKNLE